MSGLTPDPAAAQAAYLGPVSTTRGERRWTSYAGAWLGIGASPGALIVGAGLAARYDGPIPMLSILLSAALTASILWFQGSLGLLPPNGEGGNLTEIAPRYFGPLMQRILGALIALGMIGWLGFNAGLGGAAASALLHLPGWVGPLIIGAPVLGLSLRGLQSWNRLATLTTFAVIALVVLVVWKLGARASPVALRLSTPGNIVLDMAAFAGYLSVFSVRAPDMTAGMGSRRDLLSLISLLILPIIAIILAGASLYQGTGALDLVRLLSGPGGLPVGNLLVALAVIAPTFTILYSGAPALRAALPLGERTAMVVISAIGLGLAVARFDLRLLAWLGVLSALLPPVVIPLAVESTRRRMGKTARLVPLWTWLPGSAVSAAMTLAGQPLALLAGLLLSAVGTAAGYWIVRKR